MFLEEGFASPILSPDKEHTVFLRRKCVTEYNVKSLLIVQ